MTRTGAPDTGPSLMVGPSYCNGAGSVHEQTLPYPSVVSQNCRRRTVSSESGHEHSVSEGGGGGEEGVTFPS